MRCVVRLRLTLADKSLPGAEIDDAAWTRIKTRCDNALVERDNVEMNVDADMRRFERIDMFESALLRAQDDRAIRPVWEPPLRWLLLLPAWREVLEADADADDEELEERIEELVEDYSSAAEEVRADAIATLAATVMKNGGEREENESDADLVARASSAFRCTACKYSKEPFVFPAVLDHECSRVSYDYETVKQVDRPMRKMAMHRTHEAIETALEAASLNVKITASSLQTARFFVSPAMSLGPGRQVPPELLAKTYPFYELVRIGRQPDRTDVCRRSRR